MVKTHFLCIRFYCICVLKFSISAESKWIGIACVVKFAWCDFINHNRKYLISLITINFFFTLFRMKLQYLDISLKSDFKVGSYSDFFTTQRKIIKQKTIFLRSLMAKTMFSPFQFRVVHFYSKHCMVLVVSFFFATSSKISWHFDTRAIRKFSTTAIQGGINDKRDECCSCS